MRYKSLSCAIAMSVGVLAAPPSLADLNDGLVAYYPFNGNAQDASGQDNHGTEHGGLNYAAGKIGQAANFDGVNDKILFSAISHDYFGNNDFSISFYFSTAQSRNAVLSKREPCLHDHFFDIRGGSEGINFEIDDNLRQNYSVLVYSEGNANQWYLYTAVKNGKNIRLYIDGDLVKEHSTTSVMDISNNATLGISNSPCIGVDGTTMLKGQVDEFRIYNRALSEAEIKQLYEGVPTNCEHASYDLKKRTLTVPFVEFPVVDFLSGQATGEVELWTGTLKQIYGTTNRFRLLHNTVKRVTDGSRCPATYALKTGTLSIPYVDVPTGIAVGGKQFEDDVEVFKVILTWEPLSRNFMVQEVEKLP
jgi:hypothetical protein